MGREVRMVPADWQHPKDCFGNYIPMYDSSYEEAAKEWLEKANAEGVQEAIDYYGPAPDQAEYMPDWPKEARTHLMMYEDMSEGTPISPAFATPEELARWLADTGASSFGSSTATYDQWLRVCKGGWAPSMVITNGQILSGIEAMGDPTPKEPK